jgi:hypothetical protein
MDKTALATGYTFEFEDGSTCQMCLSFIRLKRLASKNKSLYERHQKVMMNGSKDELDTLTVLYAAYVCANMDGDNLMTEDEFLEKCGSDRVIVNEALGALTNPKKRQASAEPSN